MKTFSEKAKELEITIKQETISKYKKEILVSISVINNHLKVLKQVFEIDTTEIEEVIKETIANT